MIELIPIRLDKYDVYTCFIMQNDVPVGVLEAGYGYQPNTLCVHNFAMAGLSLAQLRSLLPLIAKCFPSAHWLTGNRVTGARRVNRDMAFKVRLQ
jgi:hypothetical protein